MVKNVVRIFDTSNRLLGTGLLLNQCVITVDHILGNETECIVKVNGTLYSAQITYRGKNEFIDIAALYVENQEKYKPNLIKTRINDDIEAKGFPQGVKFAVYPDGRHISGKVISFNYIDAFINYPYRGEYITISSDEEITEGFSGAPVFVEDALTGLVARKHIDGSLNKFNVIPISYFLEANNGEFRSLFGKYVNYDEQSILNKTKKSLMNPFHFRSETIDFFGRKEQMNQIFQFCSNRADIQWWVITGAGGIGKSRLAYEFAKNLNENIWNSVMLNTYDYESLMERTSNINKNTFIVLDYVQQNIKEIGKWLYRLSENEVNYKVRIILLERYGKSYKSSKWIERLNEKNCEYDVLMNMCYNPHMQLDPPFLELSSLQKEDLISIAESYSYYKNTSIDDSTVQNIIQQLEILDPGLNRPLYLIFLIDAWIDNRDLSKWNKSFILDSVLAREIHRIKLILKNVIDDDLLIKAYLNVLVYSTIMDGLRYPDDVKAICSNELNVFLDSMQIHRKDIFELFKQMGFLTEDSEGILIFEGLKPDLLGEYYIFKNYTDSIAIQNIVQHSLIFPQKAFNFFNRLLDDYFSETYSYFRSFLNDMDTDRMSEEQIFCFAEFLCERVARDNRKYSEKCFKRLSLLYLQNKSIENAVIYAYGLSNMIIEFNLKKSKKFISELKNLHFEYSNSLDIAVEYASSLVQIIDRKSCYAAKTDFKNLKRLREKILFVNNTEINLCYAKALKILCIKEIDGYESWEFYKELKSVFEKTKENKEMLYIYIQCLCGMKTTTDNIKKILSELISLCKYILKQGNYITWEICKELKVALPQFCYSNEFVFVYLQCLCELRVTPDNIEKILCEIVPLCDHTKIRRIYASYIEKLLKSGILLKEEAINWLKLGNSAQFATFEIIEEPADKSNSKQGIETVIYKSESEELTYLNTEIHHARKLAWLSNGLSYEECKTVVGEIKELYERHKDTYEFVECYLIGLITLSKHPNLNLEDSYGILENVLILSNTFIDHFDDSLKISTLEAISELGKYEPFSSSIVILLNSLIGKITMKIGSKEEVTKIIEMLYLTKQLNLNFDIIKYMEDILVNYYSDNYIQRRYVEYLNYRNKFELNLIIEKFFIYHQLGYSIITDFLGDKITDLAEKDKKARAYIWNILSGQRVYIWNHLSKQGMDILAEMYSKTILKLFMENPDLEYFQHLQDLENEYGKKRKIVFYYAKLLFDARIEGIIGDNEILEEFMKFQKKYSGELMRNLARMYAKTILQLFEVNPKPEYYYCLHDLEHTYRKDIDIALNYAELLSYAGGIIENNEIYDQFWELQYSYSDKHIMQFFQRTLSKMVVESIPSHTFFRYIVKQKAIYKFYHTPDIAKEYCYSLSMVSSYITQDENLTNFFVVKSIARCFPNEDFSEYLKIINDQINWENEEDEKKESNYI